MKFNDFILTSTIFLVSRFAAAATVSFEEDQAASSAARKLKPAERTNNENHSSSMHNRYSYIPTKKAATAILKNLREARAFQTQSESQSDLQPGARSVPISRFGPEQPPGPRAHMFVDITYGPGLVKVSTVDTGNDNLMMDDFEALQEAQPGIVVINNDTSYWGEPAKHVKGKFTIHVINSDGSQEDLTLETEFYACSPSCSRNNIGLSNGFGSNSPLKNQQGIEYMTFDLTKNPSLHDRMILQPAYECNDLDRLWIDDRDFGGNWAFVFINSLKVGGVQTAWARGTKGPPQQKGNNGTMGMMDTGGGPVYLATGNIPGFPTIPPPQNPAGFDGQLHCQYLFPFFFDVSYGYEGCSCYYGDVEFELQSAASNVTKTIRWTNDDIASVPMDPTFVGCEVANVGRGNYANLGSVMFALNKITMSVNTYEACVESVAPNYEDPRPTEDPTPPLTKKSKKAKKYN